MDRTIIYISYLMFNYANIVLLNIKFIFEVYLLSSWNYTHIYFYIIIITLQYI